MAKYQLNINGEDIDVDVDPQMPLLWVLRDEIGLVGTKFGCGIARCGACTVHVSGQPIRSCITPASMLAGQPIRTIEGLANGTELHPLQQAWIDVDVPQCGYCQAGQIMSAAALLEQNPSPTNDDIDAAMVGNYCRCGAYNRIRKAIHLASENTTTPFYDASTPNIEQIDGDMKGEQA